MDESGYQGYRGRGNRGYRGRRSSRGTYRPPRSLSQMGRDDRAEQQQQQEKIDELKAKDVKYDAEKTEKQQPKREAPKLDAPKIRLDMDYTDWIEKHRANVEIRLNEGFEDEIIKAHSKQIDYSVTVLQYSSAQQRKDVKLMYESYSILNVAYRLLMTLPRSQKRKIADLLTQLQMGDQPRNTPLIAEMCSHLGKHKNEAYGNLRIEGQMLEARRRIIRSILRAHSVTGMDDEFKWKYNRGPKDVDTSKEVIWNDADSLSWLRHRALDEFERLRKINWGVGDMNVKITGKPEQQLMGVCLPYIDLHLTDPDSGGPWHLTPVEVEFYYKMLKGYKEDIVQQAMAIMIIFMVSTDCFAHYTSSIESYYPDLSGKLGGFEKANMLDLLGYLQLQQFASLMTDEDLMYNYSCIVDGYESIAEPTIRQIFKTVPITNHEFGDEAQMMKVTDASLHVNPRVESAFKIKDGHLIGASGIFSYPMSVRYNVADYTVLKRAKKPIISELIEKFCRK